MLQGKKNNLFMSTPALGAGANIRRKLSKKEKGTKGKPRSASKDGLSGEQIHEVESLEVPFAKVAALPPRFEEVNAKLFGMLDWLPNEQNVTQSNQSQGNQVQPRKKSSPRAELHNSSSPRLRASSERKAKKEKKDKDHEKKEKTEKRTAKKSKKSSVEDKKEKKEKKEKKKKEKKAKKDKESGSVAPGTNAGTGIAKEATANSLDNGSTGPAQPKQRVTVFVEPATVESNKLPPPVMKKYLMLLC